MGWLKIKLDFVDMFTLGIGIVFDGEEWKN